MENGLLDRVVIVTGGGRGLGRAFALDLARRGATVVVNNRNRVVDREGLGPADHVVAEITAGGGVAIADHCDASDPDSGRAMVSNALDRFGRLDGMITSAAISQERILHSADLDEIEALIDINVLGTFRAVRAALDPMRQERRGRILIVGSVGGLHGGAGLSAYCASKGAVIALGRSLAHESARYGVHTNVLLPYATTQMTAGAVSSDVALLMDPASVAPVASALVDPRCDLNGEVIIAGGGAIRTVEIREHATVALGAEVLTPARLSELVAQSAAGPGSTHPDALAAFDSLVADLRAVG